MQPRYFLRSEGLAVVASALVGYFAVDGPLWLLAVLVLVPDVSMLGYLGGPRLGSRTYNVVHTYTAPAALGAVGVWADVRLAILIALVWIVHIGADRTLGYGLKYESGFTDTHLSKQPAPFDALTEHD